MAEITLKDGRVYKSKSPDDILLVQVMDGFNLLGTKLPLIFSQMEKVISKPEQKTGEENQPETVKETTNFDVIKIVPFLISQGLFYDVAALLFLNENDEYISAENVKLTKSLAVLEALRDFFTGIKKQWIIIEPLFQDAKKKMSQAQTVS